MRVKAARLVEHGQPLEVSEVELAEPAPAETVVDLHYGGVNPVDRYGALGRVAANGPVPRTLGGEAAGVAGGRRVMVRGHGLGTMRDGLWASAAVVPEAALIEVPEGVSLQQAAATGIAGVTAWRCVTEKASVTTGDRVLVLGASGGVGSAIVTLAHSLGATVWGQTAGAGKADWVRARGAAEVIVGEAAAVADKASELRPTVVFDPLGGNFTGAAIESMAERGRLVLFGASAEATGELPLLQVYRKALTILGYGGLIESDEALSAGIVNALQAQAAGQMEIPVDRVLPLEDVNSAFELLVERKVQGKLLLDLRRSAT
jgi:NADPH2:quinone reductase